MARPKNPHRTPVLSALPLVHQLDGLLRADPRPQREIFRQANLAQHMHGYWKRGQYAPTLNSLNVLGKVLGYRLEFVPIKEKSDG